MEAAFSWLRCPSGQQSTYSNTREFRQYSIQQAGERLVLAFEPFLICWQRQRQAAPSDRSWQQIIRAQSQSFGDVLADHVPPDCVAQHGVCMEGGGPEQQPSPAGTAQSCTGFRKTEALPERAMPDSVRPAHPTSRSSTPTSYWNHRRWNDCSGISTIPGWPSSRPESWGCSIRKASLG